MRSENLDLALDSPLAGQAFKRAVTISIFLHVLLLGYLLNTRFSTSAPQPAVVTPGARMSVDVVFREVGGDELPGVALLSKAGAKTQSPGLAAGTTAEETTNAPDTSSTAQLDRTLEPASAVTSRDDTAAPVKAETAGPSITQASLATAITGYVRNQQSGLTSNWMEACPKYQKEHVTRECPQQQEPAADFRQQERLAAERVFADATRADRHARLRNDFREKDTLLQTLQEAGGPLAELAASRQALNREYSAYLSGNLNTAAMNFVKISQLNNRNLPFMLGTMLQFICDPSPCVYEYTGFRMNHRKAKDSEAEPAGNK